MRIAQRSWVAFLCVVMIAAIVSVPAFAASQTFTGVVGDAMCGAKHVMAGDEASCTHGCTAKGSKYALLVGEKVYTLDATSEALLSIFNDQAGNKVVVIGTEKNNTITVTSVKPAR